MKKTCLNCSQVTYEDAMISGLLSTLNEEAQEDVLNEEDEDSLHRGSSGNLSFNESLDNFEVTSPMQRRSSRDIERGALVAAAVSAKSHSIIASAIGGGGGGAGLGWDFGSAGDLGMISVPTSPTAQSPILPQQFSR